MGTAYPSHKNRELSAKHVWAPQTEARGQSKERTKGSLITEWIPKCWWFEPRLSLRIFHGRLISCSPLPSFNPIHGSMFVLWAQLMRTKAGRSPAAGESLPPSPPAGPGRGGTAGGPSGPAETMPGWRPCHLAAIIDRRRFILRIKKTTA
eukprot:scaffold302578_cov16-Prasinocladus_malaysianus.AAC.1